MNEAKQLNQGKGFSPAIKKLLVVCLLTDLSAAVAPKSERDIRVPVPSAALVRPILEKAAELYRDPECQGGDYEGRCQKLFTEYQDRMFALFQVSTPEADEALVVLLAFPSAHGYSREPHPTEALTCAIAERGNRMLRYLSNYEAWSPDIRDATRGRCAGAIVVKRSPTPGKS